MRERALPQRLPEPHPRLLDNGVMEHAENSEGTVRRIGRPFPPGQSGNPEGDRKGLQRHFARCAGVRPSFLPRSFSRLRWTPRPVTAIASRPHASCSIEAGARRLGLPTSRVRTLSNRTRSQPRSGPSLSNCGGNATRASTRVRIPYGPQRVSSFSRIRRFYVVKGSVGISRRRR